MFQRLIRVILTAEITRFAAGMGRASSLLSGFLGTARNAFTGAVGFVNNLVNALAHLPDAFETITGAIEGLFGGAMQKERQEAVFKSLTGSAEQAAQMMNFLRETSLRLGVDMDNLAPSAQQVAVALRSANGEVDPALWEELTMAIVKFSTLRPDVPIELWGRAISGLLSGHVSTLTRLLDVNVSQMGQLSQEVKDFLNSTNEAREQQLGTVTRLGADTAGDRDTALQALREILEATGATDDLLQASADTTQGKLDRLKAAWEDFVDRVAVKLLPILTEALDKLLAWIDEHEAEIEEFLEGLGKTVKEAWDELKKVDWNKVGEDLAKAGEDAEKAWEWILGFLETVGQVIDTLETLYGMLPGQNGQGLGGQATGGEWGAEGSLVGALMGKGRPSGPIGAAGQALDQSAYPVEIQAILQKLEQWIDGSAGTNRQTLDIRFSVDENGNIVPVVTRIADERATNAIAEFVGAKGGTHDGRKTGR